MNVKSDGFKKTSNQELYKMGTSTQPTVISLVNITPRSFIHKAVLQGILDNLSISTTIAIHLHLQVCVNCLHFVSMYATPGQLVEDFATSLRLNHRHFDLIFCHNTCVKYW